MTHYITTESGSIYELDVRESRIRRLHGVKNPTQRTGKDGEWKKLDDAVLPTVGRPMTLVWGIDGDPKNDAEPGVIPEGLPRIRVTITSHVISVEESAFEG